MVQSRVGVGVGPRVCEVGGKGDGAGAGVGRSPARGRVGWARAVPGRGSSGGRARLKRGRRASLGIGARGSLESDGALGAASRGGVTAGGCGWRGQGKDGRRGWLEPLSQNGLSQNGWSPLEPKCTSIFFRYTSISPRASCSYDLQKIILFKKEPVNRKPPWNWLAKNMECPAEFHLRQSQTTSIYHRPS